jgi:hypothetical protein
MGELMGELVRLGFLFTVWVFGIWVGGASVAAWVAWEKGREPVAWFVLAFFLSPLVALIALSAVPTQYVPSRRPARARRARRDLARSVVPARRANGANSEEKRWDVVTSAATTTRRPW